MFPIILLSKFDLATLLAKNVPFSTGVMEFSRKTFNVLKNLMRLKTKDKVTHFSLFNLKINAFVGSLTFSVMREKLAAAVGE